VSALPSLSQDRSPRGDTPQSIVKRNGVPPPFDANKIRSAIARAGKATGEFDDEEANRLPIEAIEVVAHRFAKQTPHIEPVQDIVEQALISADYFAAARAHVVYREKHDPLRRDRKTVVDIADSINEYLERTDWRVNANAEHRPQLVARRADSRSTGLGFIHARRGAP
jgi:ribonucleoside-triphosphate reductase